MSDKTPHIFCALDTGDLEQAKAWAASIGPVTGGLKLGLEFFNAFGPQGIEAVQKSCPDAALFMDLKFHDISNTVAGAVRSICRNFAPAYLNVHASGGQAMMEAAREARDATAPETRLLGVTILTSLSQAELGKIGYVGTCELDSVLRLAALTQQSGFDGIVCSALEISPVREACGDDFALMVPGIRPIGADKGDQHRVMTPKDALNAGATHLVIGRPITQSANPAQAAQDIIDIL